MDPVSDSNAGSNPSNMQQPGTTERGYRPEQSPPADGPGHGGFYQPASTVVGQQAADTLQAGAGTETGRGERPEQERKVLATVGRTVHYYQDSPSEDADPQPCAAIICSVVNAEDGFVDLHVFPNQRGGATEPHNWSPAMVPFSPGPKAGHWSWPPRS